MALVTFNPPVAPSPGTKHTPKINLAKSEFGDGYTQATPNGLNHVAYAIDLRWDALTQEQFTTIREFFEGQGGYRPFFFQPRGFDAVKKWTAPAWSGSDSTPWTFEVKLQEWFGAEA